jgi:monovalent cation/proton antiporter MnhG/PhaG subunit
MNAHQLAIEVLLWIAVVSIAVSVLGMLLMKDFFEKLHYMGTVAAISAGCILAAVCLQEGWGQAAIKTILVFAIGLLMNAVLTHATARAARVRNLGHWTPNPDEQIHGSGGAGERSHQRQRSKNE